MHTHAKKTEWNCTSLPLAAGAEWIHINGDVILLIANALYICNKKSIKLTKDLQFKTAAIGLDVKLSACL